MPRPGWQLYDSVVREKLNRVDAGACAGECKARVYCRTFAFRYLLEPCTLVAVKPLWFWLIWILKSCINL